MFANYTVKVPSWLDFIFTFPLLAYRLFRYGYTFRRIYLGEGEYTNLDQRDYYRLNHYKWFLKRRGDKCYALRASNTGPFVALHREILDAPKNLVVDHKNGNGLDNRRANLRLATQSQNMINRQKNRFASTSRFVGVYFDKRRNHWSAKIWLNRKCIYLGRFDSEIDCAKAYDCAAVKYYGEFARLNLPEVATPS